MKKTTFILIAFLLFVPMLDVNQRAMASTPAVATIRNVTIAIKVTPPCYDEFITWIQPVAQNFSNFNISGCNLLLTSGKISVFGEMAKWKRWGLQNLHARVRFPPRSQK